MLPYVKRLRSICEAHPLEEKILIVDAFASGEQILQTYLEEGYHAINLKPMTVYEAARNIIMEKALEWIEPIEPSVGIQLVYQLLNSLKEKGRLRYFKEMKVTLSFSQAIYQTLKTLRLAGFTSKTLDSKPFISEEKAEDLLQLLSAYEELLEAYQLKDEADLYRAAIQAAQPMETGTIVILLSNLSFTHLERQFLDKWLPENVYKLPLAPVYGLATLQSDMEWGEPTPFSYLYQLDQVTEKPKLTLFTAQSEEAELKQILNTIKSTSARLDDCVIYYTNPDPYLTTAHLLAEKLTIPITFGEGFQVTFSRPGRLVMGVLQWVKDHYSVQRFIDLLGDGVLQLGEGAPTKAMTSRLLRDARIGWGKERYAAQLEKLSQRLAKDIEETDQNDEKRDYLEMRLGQVQWLKTWFQHLFKQLPDSDQEIRYQNMLEGIQYLLRNHAQTASATDEEAKSALLEKIKLVLPYADDVLKPFDAYEKVHDLLLEIRIQISRPKPGHLHITSFKNGVYQTRSHVFIVGLDQRKFPGQSSVDPLLLEQERVQLGHQIRLLGEKAKDNLYTMAQVLAHTAGPVSLSYCHFSLQENREVNPSHLFLQSYRLMSGHHQAEYKALQTLPTVQEGLEPLEVKDYWNELLLKNQPCVLDDDMLSEHPHLKYGLEAEAARQEEGLTAYDGLVEVDLNRHDPTVNAALHMSANRLQSLAQCPYSYFLTEVLNVRPIEEITYNPNVWLDALSRGSLLHSIFETFYKTINARHEKPTLTSHEALIIKIAHDKIAEQKEMAPPPNERVFEREVEDIIHCCLIFLKEEERHGERYDALHFEYPFGINGIEPAVVTLPSGHSIRVSGIVDRVDQSADGHYHIIDYKTGKTTMYSGNGYFRGGRQLQHFIYALAIEQHLQLEEGAVKESSYYFPSTKGEGERFVRLQNETTRTNGMDILERLIETISTGTFTMTDDEKDCTYCEFKAVCRRHTYTKEILDNKQSAATVQVFKGIRAYE